MSSRKSTSRSKSPRKPASQKGKPTARRNYWRLLVGLLAVASVLLVVVVVWLDIQVRQRFDGAKWSLAARVYARPLELYQGAAVSLSMLQQELNGLNYQPVKKITAPGHFSCRANACEIWRRSFAMGTTSESAQRLVVQFDGSRQRVRSVAGNQVIERLEPREIGSIYPASGEDRILTRLRDIPPLLGETLLAVEDKRFLYHHGISLRAITRALLADLRAGAMVQGGSTLTQQLVKNMYLSNDRSIVRKLVEIPMSLLLEWHYSKAEILEAYLNEVYLGQSGPRAVHGFALASQFYFNKPVAALDVREIALLVGLVKGASYYNPWRNPERALARRQIVLDIMRNAKLIDEPEYQQASGQSLGVVDTPSSQHAYPAFIGLVKRQLLQDYPLSVLQSEGLQIYTTLAPSVQSLAEQALSEELKALEQRYQLAGNSLQGAIVLTAVGSGEIRALVGDRQPRYAGFNRALDAERAIGSLIKPALYATALIAGEATLATLLDDSEFRLPLASGDEWVPKNYSGIDHGQVPLYLALANSYNQAAARLGWQQGVPEVINTLKQLGVERPLKALPSLLLGAAELSPLAVSIMYHTLANDGFYTPLRAIRSVYSADGEQLQRYPLASQAGISAAVAYQINFALQIAARQGTGRSVYQQLSESLSIASKTGTTNDQRDSWFAAFSGSDLGVVWVGADDNRPLPLTGATGALPVWRHLFQQLPTDAIDPLPPADVLFFWVDPETGLLTEEHCRGAVLLPFSRGQEPRARAACVREKSRSRWWRRWLEP